MCRFVYCSTSSVVHEWVMFHTLMLIIRHGRNLCCGRLANPIYFTLFQLVEVIRPSTVPRVARLHRCPSTGVWTVSIFSWSDQLKMQKAALSAYSAAGKMRSAGIVPRADVCDEVLGKMKRDMACESKGRRLTPSECDFVM